MMGHGFLYKLKTLAMICGIFSIVLGCASAPPAHETFTREGFQASLPNAGTRMVVWGNHSGAVTRTLRWLHDHHMLGIDPSGIEKELVSPGFAHRPRMDPEAQVLAAAQSLGVPLVLFVHREDSRFGQKFDLMSFGHKRTKIIAIEIRGINTETSDVVFGAKAWNSEPLVESDQMVQDLTTFALQKAWNEPDSLLPLQQEFVQQKPQRERVTVVPSYSEEMVPTLEASNSETIDPLSSDEEPSLGLQVASGALSILYAPFKVAYAGLGGIMGGLAYLLTAGNEQVAQSIWDSSIQGTYWLTAKHLQGEEPIHFKGESSRADLGHRTHLNESMSVESGVE